MTKAGTNELKGSAYLYTTNNHLRGNKVADLEEMPREQNHNTTYGFSLGGTIVKNKLFFFVNGEMEDNVKAGPTAYARPDGTEWDPTDNLYHRPTVSDMNTIKQYLATTYGYNPGDYQGYSDKVPAYKLLARLDWNVDENNSVNVRFSKSMSKEISSPSPSVSPLKAATIFPGDAAQGIGSGLGHTTNAALYFQSQRYSKDYNFTSIAAEWNAKWGELNNILREEIVGLLEEVDNGTQNDETQQTDGTPPYVILVVGVNGVGKTTTIGKLAYQFKQTGKKVYLGAADTFRAAAVEQLVAWGERVGVPVVKQQMGSDPASVAFDTLSSAKANNADVVIIDTAGRLHNKVNLMNELKKIKDVMKKVIPSAPDEVLLVLDGSTGQNAFEQAKQFAAVTQISSLAITKLDGTAKGGVVIGISDQLKVPVKYIGLGERMEDLQQFNRREFVDSLLGE